MKRKNLIFFALIFPYFALADTSKSIDVFESTKIDFKNSPKIQFTSVKHDFGEVEEGAVSKFNYQFKNVGKKDLIILGIFPGGSWISVNSSLKKIAPGENGSLEVSYNTLGRVGKDQKTIIISTNDPTHPSVTLFLEISINREINVQPDELSLGSIKKGTTETQKIEVLGKSGVSFKVLSISTKGNAISVTQGPYQGPEKQSGVVLNVTNVKDLPIGNIVEEINIKTDDPKKPEIRIPIMGKIVGRVQTFPDIVQLNNRMNKCVTVHVTADPWVGFKVKKVSTTNNWVRVVKIVGKKTENIQQGYAIVVSLKRTPETSMENEIELWTNDKEETKVSIPVKFTSIP